MVQPGGFLTESSWRRKSHRDERCEWSGQSRGAARNHQRWRIEESAEPFSLVKPKEPGIWAESVEMKRAKKLDGPDMKEEAGWDQRDEVSKGVGWMKDPRKLGGTSRDEGAKELDRTSREKGVKELGETCHKIRNNRVCKI